MMKNIKILLWFDVEDYATIESDDAFAELLVMLEETGVRSTIKFCAKKLQLLKERGRTDILSRLPQHELAFHTTLHSVHPLPTEYLDRYGFKDGAEAFEEKERSGFESIVNISGQHLTSYGQPGEAWAPQVFPVLRKWGVPTYLDAHSIVGINGQPFWYGGVLCYSDLVNLIRLQHRDGGLEQYIKDFENINTTCKECVFISTYDHPTEFSCTVFWDELNFAYGKNPLTLTPAPLRGPGEQTRYINMLRDFIALTMKQENVEYLTATEGMKLELQRKSKITETELTNMARGCMGKANFMKSGESYLAASEIFNLFAKKLTGRMLIPELLYGPEEDTPSIITNNKIKVMTLADAALNQFDTVMGYKQLCSLYKTDANMINVCDMFATLAKAVADGLSADDMVEIQKGELEAAKYIHEPHPDHPWTEWMLFRKGFYPENIYRIARMQTWTIKPAVF